MTVGIVNERGQSQRGTPKLKIDGTWYVASRMNLDGIEPGARVEYEPGSFPTQDGKQIKCINRIRIVAPAGSGPANGNGKANPAVSDDAEMRFISNVVGQAIAAKTLVEPTDIPKWVAAAKGAIRPQKGSHSEESPPFDDDIPWS